MVNKSSLDSIRTFLQPFPTKLIAVTKTHPANVIQQAYEIGLREFGENKVQELTVKASQLPTDIRWHLIGHLQTNKVKYIAPFIYMIHSVDSFKLLKEINREAAKNNRIIYCLLQVYIAREETKFGLNKEELLALLHEPELESLTHIRIQGLMGMASNTEDQQQIRDEFRSLKNLFTELSDSIKKTNIEWTNISMGMTSDYKIAAEEGSTMVRIGSAIFGHRDYPTQ